MDLKATGMAKRGLAKAVHTPKVTCVGCTPFGGGIVRQPLFVQIRMNKGLPQRDPIRKEVILGLCILSLAYNCRGVKKFTFPFCTLFGTEKSGAGIGGRDMAASIPSPVIGV